MATKTFDELKQLAIQIRDEKTNKQNTANRVGTSMLEGISKLELDYYDKTAADKELKKRDDKLTELQNGVGLYNVDKNVPLGSGYYTSTTARAAVPSSVRKLGLIITYKTDATTSVTEQFIGSDVSVWATDTNWKNVGSEGGNKILEWNTDVATTRKQVVAKERKSLLQISYRNADGDVINEQYIGTSFTDTEWAKDSNWVQILNEETISKLNTDINKNLSYNIAQMTPFFIDEKASYCSNKKGEVFKPTYAVNIYDGYKSYMVDEGQRIYIKKTKKSSGLNIVFTDANNIVLDDDIFSLLAADSLLNGAYMIVPPNSMYMHVFGGIEVIYLLSNNDNLYRLLSKKGIIGQNNIVGSYPPLKLDGTYFNISGSLSSSEIDTTYYKRLYINNGYNSGPDIVPVVGVLDESYVKIEAKTKNGVYEYYEIPNEIDKIRVNLSTYTKIALLTDAEYSNLNDEEIAYITETKEEVFGINGNSLDFKKYNISGNSSEFDSETKTIRFIGTSHLIVTAVMNEYVSFDTDTKAGAIWIGKLKLVSIEDDAESVYLTSSFDYKGDKGTIFRVGDIKTVITYADASNLIYCALTADKQSTFEVVEGQSFYIGGELYKSLLPNDSHNPLKNALTRHLNKNIKGQADIAYSLAVDMHEGYDRIVAFGDSVTANDMSWLYIVAKKLNLSYSNLAVPGSSPSYNSNLSPENLAKIPSDTGIVVITGGWNGHVEGDDFHPEDYNYEEDKDDANTVFGGVCNAINYIRSNHPMARIVLATPAKGATSLSVQPWCYIFSTIAEKQNIILADVDRYGDWEYISNEAFIDGVHPNSNGSLRIASIILDAIRRIIC